MFERDNFPDTEMDKLREENKQMRAALESVKGQFTSGWAHHYGCGCGQYIIPNDSCFETRRKVLEALDQKEISP